MLSIRLTTSQSVKPEINELKLLRTFRNVLHYSNKKEKLFFKGVNDLFFVIIDIITFTVGLL